MPKVAAEDYEALKGFCGLMFDRIGLVIPGMPAEDYPMAVLERLEKQSMSIARTGLGMAIGDMIEDTMDYPPEEVAALDRELEAAGLPTLSAMRARFSARIARILKRGTVRTESEYYLLRNAVDSMPEAESRKAWEMLAAFELAVPPPDAGA